MSFFKRKESNKKDKEELGLIKVLGTGCKKCEDLEKNTRDALKEMNREELVISKVKELKDIASYGVMQTPALVVGDKVVAYGKTLSKEEIKALLESSI